MPPETDWRTVAAQIIYDGYPDSDLLPIEPPGPGQPIGAFKIQAEAAERREEGLTKERQG